MSKTNNTKNTVPFFNNAIIPNPISGDLYEILEEMGVEPRFAQKGDSGARYELVVDRYRLIWKTDTNDTTYAIVDEETGEILADGEGDADDMVHAFLGDEDWMPEEIAR